MAKMKQKDRERVVALYLNDRQNFSKEKFDMIQEKIRLEAEEYSYDADDPFFYELLDAMADNIYQLTINIGLYHWVEDNFKKDEVYGLTKTASKNPKKIIHRWIQREKSSYGYDDEYMLGIG